MPSGHATVGLRLNKGDAGKLFNFFMEGQMAGKRKTLLQEADGLVNGQKHDAYGTWGENWSRVRDMARASGRPGLGEITCEDLMVLMILVKIARETSKAQHDNPLDIAGYAQGLDEVRGL